MQRLPSYSVVSKYIGQSFDSSRTVSLLCKGRYITFRKENKVELFGLSNSVELYLLDYMQIVKKLQKCNKLLSTFKSKPEKLFMVLQLEIMSLFKK